RSRARSGGPLMSQEHTTTDPAIGRLRPPTDRSPAVDVLSKLRELLAADEAATVIVGIDGTMIDANPAGVALFPGTGDGTSTDDGLVRLRNVIEQVPQQLLVDPEGGVWRGEIDFTQ